MDSTRFSPWRESALLLIAKLAPGTDFIEYYARCLVKSRSGTGSSAIAALLGLIAALVLGFFGMMYCPTKRIKRP